MTIKRKFTTGLVGIITFLCMPAVANDNDYDVVTISVQASSYDASHPPQFARVKYNKLCPLVITSDDMGRVEFVRNWAYFNGYPVFSSNYFGQLDDPMTLFDAPYNTTTQSWQESAMTATSWEPLTYSDGTGGVRRFTATSAIMPYKIDNANYAFINPNMAKAMVRTGWSFAQHDVADQWPSGVSTDEQKQQYIREQLPIQSQKMEEITGYGLKVIVEPNGNKNYMAAGIASEEICWNIFQNATTEYPAQSKLISYWTDTTNGLPTTFASKPTGAWERYFFQSHESTLRDNYINTADGTSIIMGGTHGMTNDALTIFKDISLSGTSAKKDQFWVAGADEVWEYYYLYHNASIQNISYANGTLTFEVKVPRYKKSQFRELTINIPGITNGTACTFSDAVVTGSSAQNTGQYTINLGLEANAKAHLEELIALYRANLHNEYLKRDCQYLIDLLKPGTTKEDYQAQLDAEPTYSYTVKNSFDDIITSGSSDVANEVNYKYPKYILHEGTLYESTKNTNKIQGTNYAANYVGAFTPGGKNQVITVDYAATAIGNVSFYSEGEDLDGVTVATESFAKISNNSGIAYALRYASNGGAAEILSPVTATTITPGKYTLVAAIGDTHTSATAQFAFKVGDKTVLSLTTEDVSGYIKEYTKEGITVKTSQPLTIEAMGSSGSFWVDYLYLVKTGEYDASTPDVELTTETATVDMTDDSSKTVTITATATAKGDAAIVNTVIKDSNDQIVAESTAEAPTTCSYTFTPSNVGDVVFTAEATDNTDNGGKTGLSDELAITVMSDFTLTATSSMGDAIEATTFSRQTADKSYRFLYPRFLLKGTTLYETEARSTNVKSLHYGESITFTLANNAVSRTIDYQPVAPNVVFYSEGEDISGTRTWTWENNSLDFGKAETYALTLGSMGKCGALTNVTVTTLPAGTYKVVAGIGTTNSATWTFKYGSETLGTFTPSTTYAVSSFISNSFVVTEDTPLTITSSMGKDNSQNWLDYIYIQKLDAIPVTITNAGYATFSSPYALDFSAVSNIKAYTATSATDGMVNMTLVNGPVPASTGLLLQGSVGSATNASVPLATTLPTTIENNLLVAHDGGIVAAGNYVFSGRSNGTELGFRILSTDTEVPAGRSYLTLPSGGSARLSITFDDTPTIISPSVSIPSEQLSPFYNLNGQQMSGNRGIIISNRKKYVKH